MEVGCPCPSVCNDIATPRHLLEKVRKGVGGPYIEKIRRPEQKPKTETDTEQRSVKENKHTDRRSEDQQTYLQSVVCDVAFKDDK